jgi:P4 family phage/plasmid primase-like protien
MERRAIQKVILTAQELYDSGLTHIIPVIPPGAPLAPLSKVAQASVGKVPGRKNSNGTWGGFDWVPYRATETDPAKWQADGANIGLQAAHFPGLDVDVKDEGLAKLISSYAITALGAAPIRTGRAPKRLLIYRTETPFSRMRLWILGADKKREQLVEVLGLGNQYVVAGTHPATLKPYEWDAQPHVNHLRLVDREKMERFFSELEALLHMLGHETEREGDGLIRERSAASAQSDLVAPSIDILREAVAAVENTAETREEYIRMGYAIRAACGDDIEDGFNIFADWAERWKDGVNSPETVSADWRRMRAPFAVGWNFLAELARGYGWHGDAPLEFTCDEPTPEDRPLLAANRSDQDLADIVVRECSKEMRYLPEQGKYIVWDNARWQPDADLLAHDLVKRVLRRVSDTILRGQYGDVAARKAAFAEAKALCSAGRAAAVLTMVDSERAIATSVKHLDRDPWLLATPGGYVDLRTGEMKPADPDALVSKVTLVPPVRAPMPVFERFLEEVTGGDAELKKYIQKLAGYALTGSTREQCITFFYGPGGNGKGVLLTAWLNILGDYATQAAMTTFTASNNERHSTEIASLMGARLVISSETQAGHRWDEAKVKSLSGGDKVSARFMRQDNVVFTPQFKLVFAGNHKPEVRDLDDAMRRRLHLVPFRFKPKVVDRELPVKLEAEYPMMLQWMIDGALLWQAEGLTPLPSAIEKENEAYFGDNDPVGRWMEEATEHTIGSDANATALYESWRQWANANGEYPGSARRLSDILAKKGVTKSRKAGGTFYHDIQLVGDFAGQ